MPRLEFPKRVRDAAIKRAGGHCEKCSAVLKRSEGQIDHILPDGLGGKPELANAQVLCRVCHDGKTHGQDIPAMRKADRVRKRDTGVTRPTGKLKSRNNFAASRQGKRIELPYTAASGSQLARMAQQTKEAR